MYGNEMVANIRKFYTTTKTDAELLSLVDAVIFVQWRDIATVSQNSLFASSLNGNLLVKKDCLELVKIGVIALLAKADGNIELGNNYSSEYNLLLEDIRKRNDEYDNFDYPKVKEV